MRAYRDTIKGLEKFLRAGVKLNPADNASPDEINAIADLIEFCSNSHVELKKVLSRSKVKKEVDEKLTLIKAADKPVEARLPWGTYGKWDYPNFEWLERPTLKDVEELRAQKLCRYPGNQLWVSEEATIAWMENNGMIPQQPGEIQ